MGFVSVQTALMLTGMMVNFCSSVNYSFQSPFYPPYAEHRQIHPFWYCLVGGLGDGMYILTLFCHRIYQKVDLRKMVWLSLIVQTLSVGLFGLTNLIKDDDWFIFWCIVLRTITGLSLTNLTSVTFAMIVLELKHVKAIAMANFEVAFSIGMICGPTFGGYLYAYVGYSYSFLILASFNFLVFVVCKVNFGHLNCSFDKHRPINVLALIGKPLIFVNMLEIVFIAFIFSLINNIFSPYLENTFALNSYQIGTVFAFLGLIQIVAQNMTGQLLHRKIKIYKINMVGMIFLLIGLFFVSPSLLTYRQPSFWITIGSSLTLMFGVAMKFLTNTFELVPVIIDLGYDEDNVFVYVSVYMLIYTSISVGILAGSLMTGSLVEKFQFSGTCHRLFLILFVTFVVTRIVYAYIWRFKRKDRISVDKTESVSLPVDERTPLIQ